MMRWGKFRRFACFAAIVAGIGPIAVAQDAMSRPSSQASTTRPAGFYRAPLLMMTLIQIRGSVAQMNLPDDQNTKVTAILDQAQKKAGELANEMQGTPPAGRAIRVNPFLQNLREQLATVLTPDQMQTIQNQLRPAAGAARGPLAALQNDLANLNLSADQQQKVSVLMADTAQQLQTIRQQSASSQPSQKQAQTIRQKMRVSLAGILTADQLAKLRDANQQRDLSATIPPPSAAHRSGPATMPDYPDVGTAAPDFHVTTLDGKTLSLADFKGKPLVIEFGSLTCPTFRDHARQMELLSQKESGKANFLVIFTREAHPVGGWEIQTNKNASISVPDPTDLPGRIALATQAQNSLKITLPMAVDSMTNPACDAYALFPNGAVVIGKDGKIIARQEWTSPDGLQAAIEQAAN